MKDLRVILCLAGLVLTQGGVSVKAETSESGATHSTSCATGLVVDGSGLDLSRVDGIVTALGLEEQYPTLELTEPDGTKLTLVTNSNTYFRGFDEQRDPNEPKLRALKVGQPIRVECFTDQAGRNRAWIIRDESIPWVDTASIPLPAMEAAASLEPVDVSKRWRDSD